MSAIAMAPMFPRRPEGQQKREKGKPRRQLGLRVGGRILEWVEEGEDAGFTATAAVLKGLEVSIDASDELGDAWWEVERRANLEGLSPGTMLGRLAKAALEAERKPGKR